MTGKDTILKISSFKIFTFAKNIEFQPSKFLQLARLEYSDQKNFHDAQIGIFRLKKFKLPGKTAKSLSDVFALYPL
jgi:hypothetical protein